MAGQQPNQVGYGEGYDQTDNSVGTGVSKYTVCPSCFRDQLYVDVRIGSKVSCECGAVLVVSATDPELVVQLEPDTGNIIPLA